MIELTSEFKKALDLMENTNKNLIIFGRAGTGKSTLLKYFVSKTSKEVAVLAPTGVAALNVGGQTIHSFFGFKPNVMPDDITFRNEEFSSLCKSVDTFIIDEISMVRADLLDSIDKSLRIHCRSTKPFGGKQMIFFGDLFQLPPVLKRSEKEVFYMRYKTPYFFSAKVMNETDFEVLTLSNVFRQHDSRFLDILNAIRHGEVTDELLETLNSRYMPDFEPPEGDYYVYLAAKKNIVNKINLEKLDKIKGKMIEIKGTVIGDFPKDSLPTEETLVLKKGAQVMLLNNDPEGNWVNGSMGRVHDFDFKEEKILVELENNGIVKVGTFKWDVYRYTYNKKKKSIETVKVGSFEQFPIKLAWAITIHKSQGLTFDKVVLDIRGGIFAPGQLYVALSRCRTLEGLVLKKKIEKKHIFLDRNIVNFMKRIENGKFGLITKNEIERTVKDAVKSGRKIKMIYMKGEEEIERILKPLEIREQEYNGRKFTALIAQKEDGTIRNYNIRKIIDIDII